MPAGFLGDPVNIARSLASVAGSHDRYTISAAPKFASAAAPSVPRPDLGGSSSTNSGRSCRFLQKVFRFLVVRNNLHTRAFRVVGQVAAGRQISVHADDPFERPRQRQSEKSHSGIQVERQITFCSRGHRGQQLLSQKAVHLKK